MAFATEYRPRSAAGSPHSDPAVIGFHDMADLFVLRDDYFVFDTTSTTGGYTTQGDSPTVATSSSSPGGLLSITATGTDNNEGYVASTLAAWKLAANKRLWFEARVKLNEAATNASNIIIGLSSFGAAANLLVDDGGGPPSSYSGALFFKLDGGAVWQFEASVSTTQATNTNAGAFTSGLWTTLSFDVHFDASGANAIVTPYVNGTASTAVTIALASQAALKFVAGVKAGSANAETLLIDYVEVRQTR